MKPISDEQKIVELTMNVYKQEFEREEKKEKPEKKGPLAVDESYIDMNLSMNKPLIRTRLDIKLTLTDVDLPVEQISRQILRNVHY